MNQCIVCGNRCKGYVCDECKLNYGEKVSHKLEHTVASRDSRKKPPKLNWNNEYE